MRIGEKIREVLTGLDNENASVRAGIDIIEKIRGTMSKTQKDQYDLDK